VTNNKLKSHIEVLAPILTEYEEEKCIINLEQRPQKTKISFKTFFDARSLKKTLLSIFENKKIWYNFNLKPFVYFSKPFQFITEMTEHNTMAFKDITKKFVYSNALEDITLRGTRKRPLKRHRRLKRMRNFKKLKKLNKLDKFFSKFKRIKINKFGNMKIMKKLKKYKKFRRYSVNIKLNLVSKYPQKLEVSNFFVATKKLRYSPVMRSSLNFNVHTMY